MVVSSENIVLNDLQESNWLIRFLVSMFFLFFVPFLLGVVFLILTAPWFDRWFIQYAQTVMNLYFLKFIMFIAAAYIITRIWTLDVIDTIQKTDTLIENY